MSLPVIIATYNRERLLKQTLDSLKKNSDGQIEVIVVNDASTDNTAKLLGTETSNYYNFAERVPIGRVRNKGVEFASDSEYLYFSDDDIYFEPHWDTILLETLNFDSSIGLVCGRKHPHHNILRIQPYKDYEILFCDSIPGYSFLMRRSLFNEIGGFEEFPLGVYGFEDSRMRERVEEKGFRAVAVSPPVVFHCGLRATNGFKAADYNEIMLDMTKRPDILFL